MRDEWIRWSWVADHTDDISAALREHVVLTVAAVALGLVIALPAGVLAAQHRRLLAPVLSVSGILYAIPSLAAFGLLGPLTGYLSFTTALLPLTSYTLLILIRNVVAGLDDVPDEARDAATGMGYGRWRRLRRVALPLAVPAIGAGPRIATVRTRARVRRRSHPRRRGTVATLSAMVWCGKRPICWMT